jgi:hypothetical protein
MSGIGSWVAAHRKLLTVIAGAALTVAIQTWGTGNPFVSLAVLAATSLGVYGVPNATASRQVPGPARSPAPTVSGPGTVAK